MKKGSKHSQEVIEKIRQSCIGITRVRVQKDNRLEMVCEFCKTPFFYSKFERGRRFCSVLCSSEKQWEEYKPQVKWIGTKWSTYHRLSTKEQIKMLKDLQKNMNERIKNNKVPKDTYIFVYLYEEEKHKINQKEIMGYSI